MYQIHFTINIRIPYTCKLADDGKTSLFDIRMCAKAMPPDNICAYLRNLLIGTRYTSIREIPCLKAELVAA